MRQLLGRFCIFLGILSLAAAAFLLYYNALESRHAMETSGSILTAIQSIQEEIPEKSSEVSPAKPSAVSGEPQENTPEEPQFPVDVPAKEMKTAQIDGYDYIGTLSIPILELELPVMSELDYPRLKISPCRQYGSVYTDDLVIAAHNYNSHFGRLNQLRSEDLLIFTDIDGNTYLYCVEAVEILEPTAVDAVRNNPFDLVLYTCTYGGQSRVAVFCSRVFL